MSRSRRSNRTRRVAAAVLAAVVLALGAAATSTKASETNLTGDAGGAWPSFGEQTLELKQSPVIVTEIASPAGEKPVVVSAPLPPAVGTGAFVLGGQWVVSLLWKKRKI